jgi:hypothetical protein
MIELSDDLVGIIIPEDTMHIEIDDTLPYFIYNTKSMPNNFIGIKIPSGTWVHLGNCYYGISKYYYTNNFRNSSDRRIRTNHYNKYFKNPNDNLIPLLSNKIEDFKNFKIEIIEKVTWDYQGRTD